MRAALLSLLLVPLASARLIQVDTDGELRAALPNLRAGDTLRLAPGRYRGGHRAAGLHGSARKPIIIEGIPGKPPRFENGKTGLHLTNCSHLTLRHLRFSGQRINGLNLDDGGDFATPAHHLVLENVHLSEIGSGGNHDAFKLSGVDDFIVRDCIITGWDGQAIDMVGCHRGVIERCEFRGTDRHRQTSGPQAKGGSSDIVIRHCTFQNAGARPLQLGGSTGIPFFRPKDARFEARRIEAHDNLIIGGLCAVAFSSLDGGSFHHNTIINPGKWVLRILQENNGPGFAPCRNVEFHHNLVLFERTKVRTAVNIGPGTDPASFRFHHNAWFAPDAPGRSGPILPSRESASVSNQDPDLDPETFRPAAPWAAPFGKRPE